MTSIAERAPLSRGRAWLRATLLIALLGSCASLTASPWGVLWLLVPVAVALSLLLSWRFGVWGLAVPAALAAGVLGLGHTATPWAWWIPTAALCGVWMGVREEHAEGGSGSRAWMLLPLVLLAAVLPRTAHYPAMIAHVETEMRRSDQELMQMVREGGTPTARVAELEHAFEESLTTWQRALPYALPTLLFLWIALLVYAGRSLSARTAAALRWPSLSRGRLREWRLPDGALWTFLAGLALLLGPWPAWLATGWTLLLNTGIGFCVQGVAVVESWMLARGVPSSIIALTMLFVLAAALPVFLLGSMAVGLSDVWLDFRRLEPAPAGNGEEN
ncbi:MAG: DUF2232 domain-containing protein [Candidatus Eisenbacteria bacterium]|nr:DUF2232 domain-containing protein [Candidatus Eisenbacteria bacterium]